MTITVRDLGADLGAAGCSLHQASADFADLVPVLPRRLRDRMGTWDTAVILAEGWLNGTARRERSGSGGIDGAELLRYRLHQHYDRCQVFGLNASDEYTLAIFDIGDERRSDEGTAVSNQEYLRREVVGEFHAGETVAVFEGGRAIVLCERRPDLAVTVRQLIDRLGAAMGGASAPPRGWIEPLPRDRIHVAGFVGDLTAECGNADCAVITA